MKTLLLIFALAFGYLLSGCMLRRTHEQDLIGTYRADLPNDAVEFLELRPKGECIQEIRLKDGTRYKAQGQWWYFEDTKYLNLKGTRLALTPTRELNPDVAQMLSGITGALPVSRSLTGKVTIMLHEGIDYRKL